MTSAVIPKLLVPVNDCGHRYLRRGLMRFGAKLSLRMFRFPSDRLDSLSAGKRAVMSMIRFGVNFLLERWHSRSALRQVRSCLALAVFSAPRHFTEQIARLGFQRRPVKTRRPLCSQFFSRKLGIWSSHMEPNSSNSFLQSEATTGRG